MRNHGSPHGTYELKHGVANKRGIGAGKVESYIDAMELAEGTAHDFDEPVTIFHRQRFEYTIGTTRRRINRLVVLLVFNPDGTTFRP